MHDKYEKATKDPNFFETAESIEEYVHWRIISNDYPWDNVASGHHMLIPKREFTKLIDMTQDEWLEFAMLDTYTLGKTYDTSAKNFPHCQSCPQRLHFHLLQLKSA